TCICGRTFFQLNAFSMHERTCTRTKKRLSGALAKAKELWSSRKRQRTLAMGTAIEPNGPPATATPDPAPALKISSQVIHEHHITDGTSLAERRPRRANRRLPLRFRDYLPQRLSSLPPAGSQVNTLTPTALPSPPDPVPGTIVPGPHFSSSSSRQEVPTAVPCPRRILETGQNSFGLFRRYEGTEIPVHDPEEHVTIADLSNTLPVSQTNRNSDSESSNFGPYPNESSFRLGEWFWSSGTQKSQASFRELLDIVEDPSFCPQDIRGTNWRRVDQKLAASDSEDEWIDLTHANWQKASITLPVPFHKKTRDPGSKDFVVGDFYHRSIVSIICEKLASRRDCQHFHFEPYSLHWAREQNLHSTVPQDPVRVHGELYTSQSFIDAHQQVQALPPEPGCNRPRVVVALQFWSDSTHLTSFGNAKLWPLYLWFGNESKYRRCKPSCHLCNHVAYFQPLPDAFKDFAVEHTGGRGPSSEFMTHCNREFFHAQWNLLLDAEFLEAYQHGIIVTCFDGVERRCYPRFFTYSADYPEKILLACIRNRGGCPCPRCLIPLCRIQNLGMTRDMSQRKTLARLDDGHRQAAISNARKLIYEQGYAVDSAAVDRLLKPHSLVPTCNAFSEKLTPLGICIFSMFTVDLLHEVELGVWRALFIHLLRMLEACKAGHLHELDKRYRDVPTFGKSTIRRFARNSSEMKKLAARDFEDLLQCAIPVFEGLLPKKHSDVVIELLFVFAHWHALAKLRMHTDSTLDLLDGVTTALGANLRNFQKNVCSAFNTRELKREADARARRAVNKRNDRPEKPKPPPAGADQPGPPPPQSTPSTRKPKTLNLQTYKLHSLGDYADCIRRYGTTDSYSTEPGELEHRTPKRWYTRTSRKQYVKQMTHIERRQARIRRIRERLEMSGCTTRERRDDKSDFMTDSPEVHHAIGASQNLPRDIPAFLQRYAGDPVIKDFVPRLKKHLLPRLRAMLQAEAMQSKHLANMAPEMSSEDNWRFIFFKNERIYEHKLMRINYTTYDVRRAQDVINPHTGHKNVMGLVNTKVDSEEPDLGHTTGHPFWYAEVLGIFHTNVVYTAPGTLDYNPRRLEFLWVRWYENVDEKPGGWNISRLDCVRFLPMASEDAFGFLDPQDILRSCHIIPSFVGGKVHSDNISISRCIDDSADWKQYYVNRFVDRDMVMRYHVRLGVGHAYATHPDNTAGESHPSLAELDDSELNPEVEADQAAVETNHDGYRASDRGSDPGSDDDGQWLDHCDSDGYRSEEFDDEELVTHDDMYGPEDVVATGSYD
ncbi:hypothetical protein BV22DRAFT_1022211, partial [Leucogyrophana mollusca]